MPLFTGPLPRCTNHEGRASGPAPRAGRSLPGPALLPGTGRGDLLVDKARGRWGAQGRVLEGRGPPPPGAWGWKAWGVRGHVVPPSCPGLWPLCLPLCEDRCVSQAAQCVAPRRDSEGAVSFRRRALRLARRPRRDFRKPGDLTCRGAVPSEQKVHMHTHTHTHRHVRARTPV